MKKSLKLVGIFMIVMIVGIVGGLSIYFLIANNKTYYIYDLRIVEPVADQGYYIYTDSTLEYSSMKNQVINMTNSEANIREIGIYAYTSTNTTQVKVSSSDTSVAEIQTSNGHMYIVSKNAGVTTITAEVGKVTDSINVIVFNKPAEELDVFDDRYFGESYSKYFPDEVVLYADGEEYEYRYETSSLKGGEYSDDINNELLMVDYQNVDKDVFPDESNIRIDTVNKSLILRCNPETEKTTTNFPIISYSTNDNGEIRTENKPFIIKVRIITYKPQFLQLVVSKNPNFEDNFVFMSTVPDDVSKYTDEQINENKAILDNFLEYQIAESELATQNEFATYKMFFSENVEKVYFKIRKVYTNGNIVYLNPKTESSGHPYTLSPDEETDENLSISADGSYYILTLDQADFSGGSYDLTVSIEGLSHTFKFEYASLSDMENVDSYYTYDEDTGIYTFSYWDPRSHFANEIYDENGEIVGFGE